MSGIMNLIIIYRISMVTFLNSIHAPQKQQNKYSLKPSPFRNDLPRQQSLLWLFGERNPQAEESSYDSIDGLDGQG